MTPQQKINDDKDIAVLDQINAMRSYEENITIQCYFTAEVDEPCRKAMVDWCFTIVDAFDLSRETVAITMSILDRYLSSNKGRSNQVLNSKQQYQLAVITALFISVKLHEPVQLGIDLLLKLCRGYYSKHDIISMEQDILESLDYRIYASTTTPMEYVRHLLKLLPEWGDVQDVINERATQYSYDATTDFNFSVVPSLHVAIACIARALEDDESCTLSELEKRVLWAQLSRKLDLDIASPEMRKVEMTLLAKTASSMEKRQSHTSLPRSSQLTSDNKSSPISVMQMVR